MAAQEAAAAEEARAAEAAAAEAAVAEAAAAAAQAAEEVPKSFHQGLTPAQRRAIMLSESGEGEEEEAPPPPPPQTEAAAVMSTLIDRQAARIAVLEAKLAAKEAALETMSASSPALPKATCSRGDTPAEMARTLPAAAIAPSPH